METKALSPINLLRLTVFILTFVIGCQDSIVIENTDPNITMSQGRIFYKGAVFTGRIHQENPAMEEFYFTSYKNGREDGEYLSQKRSGQLLEKRYFKEGLKIGIHRSWYPNGNNRLYSEFDNGKYINDRWEWYDTGKPYIYEKFDKDGKILVTKMWNRQGHIYMNIAFAKNGSSVGMPGSKICNPIKPMENEGN